MKNTKKLVFGIGNPLIDLVIPTTDDDLVKLDINKGTMALVDQERQKEIIDYFKTIKPQFYPGGSAPNTIIACAGLGIDSYIAGKIGQDNFGDIYLDRLKKFGVNSGLVNGNGITGSSIILVTPDGERSMNTHLGMCREFAPDDINVKQLSKSKYLYFTGYMWDTHSQKKAIQKAIFLAQEKGIKIVFDVADPFVVERNRDEFLLLIKNDVDIVFANEWELNILFSSKNVHQAIDSLADIVQTAGIKLGKEGSVVFHEKEKYNIKPKPILAQDTTGAGDMYAAGFLASICRGSGYEEAGKVAVYLAEEIIQIQGAQFRKREIEFLKSKIF